MSNDYLQIFPGSYKHKQKSICLSRGIFLNVGRMRSIFLVIQMTIDLQVSISDLTQVFQKFDLRNWLSFGIVSPTTKSFLFWHDKPCPVIKLFALRNLYLNPLTDTNILGGLPVGHLLYLRYLARNNL